MSTDDEQRPSLEAADPVAWSIPDLPRAEARGPARRWVHVVGLLLLLTGPVLFVDSLVRGDRSMDLPFGDDVRYGLMGNGLPKVWWCSEGHEHWSAPFWLASLALVMGSFVVWRLLARRFTRA